MGIPLVVYEISTDSPKLIKHETYRNFVKQIDTQEWLKLYNPEREHMLNQLLAPYQARVTEFEFRRITFEFESQDDLTHFALTYS